MCSDLINSLSSYIRIQLVHLWMFLFIACNLGSGIKHSVTLMSINNSSRNYQEHFILKGFEFTFYCFCELKKLPFLSVWKLSTKCFFVFSAKDRCAIARAFNRRRLPRGYSTSSWSSASRQDLPSLHRNPSARSQASGHNGIDWRAAGPLPPGSGW